jgi:ABC-type transport system involved in multi-copper enzyme maturation permease subunit
VSQTAAVPTAARTGEGWVGPLFGWELLRLGRRGTPTAVRVVVAMLLLAVLWVVYQSRFPSFERISWRDHTAIGNELTQFAEAFALVFMQAQLALIVLLTPIFVAGGIVEEQDRKTLEFLLATDLSSREIVLGKYLSRTAQMLGVLLAGLPVLAVTQVWGGVDVLFIAVGYAISLFSVFAVGGIAAACAVGARSLRQALARSYAMTFLFMGVLVLPCPFVWVQVAMEDLPHLNEGDLWSWLFVAGHLASLALVAALGVVNAVSRMRDAAFYYAPRPSSIRVTARPGGEARRHWTDPPRVRERPLWWKERYFSGGANRFLRLMTLVPAWLWVLVVMTAAMIGLGQSAGSNVHQQANAITRNGTLILMGVLALTVGLSAAGSVPKERQQQTITDLLMVPRPRRHILGAKWLASAARGGGVFCGILALLLFGIISEGIAWESAPLLLLATLALTAFATSLGLYLGVRCRTVMRASNLWMLVVVLLLGVTYIAAEALTPDVPFSTRGPRQYEPRSEESVWDRILHPPAAWRQLAFRWDERDGEYWDYDDDGMFIRRGVLPHSAKGIDRLFPALTGLLLYALLAWLFWVAAVISFRREGRG